MLGELWSFQGRYRTLHLTWFAFFLTFVVWFNLAPLATTVKADLGLTLGQIRTVAICSVALTIPARVLIGMLLHVPSTFGKIFEGAWRITFWIVTFDICGIP